MNYRFLPNHDLVSLLIGKRATHKLYTDTLNALFAPEGGPDTVHPKIQAAHELVRRWLEESLRRSSVVESPAATRQLLSAMVHDKPYESFLVLFLDNRHRLISAEEMFRGTIDSASVHPREIVRRAIQVNAAAIVLAHNHPSGVAEPSIADTVLTTRIKESLALIDVRVIDHFVVGDTEMVSFAERGLV